VNVSQLTFTHSRDGVIVYIEKRIQGDIETFTNLSDLYCGFESMDFPSKIMLCRFSLDLPLFGLGTSSQGYGSNLWLSSIKVALFHWSLDLGSSSKGPLDHMNKICI